MREGAWNIPLIQIMFPNHISSQILATPIVEEDCAFWENGDANEFSTKQVWSQTRERKEIKSIYGLIWHNNIPAKISMLVWRIMQDMIPTEMRMKGFGIQLASKCMCCQEEETTNHLFLDGDKAQAIWKHVGKIANIQSRKFRNIEELLKHWIYSHDWVQKGHVRIWVPLVTIWGIWKARNEAKHNNIAMSVKNIIASVETKLQYMAAGNHLKTANIAGETIFMEKFGVRSIKRKKRKVSCITWKKPDLEWLKLNTDGCSRGNPGPAGAGGVVRNSDGLPLWSFSSYLGYCSAFLAELEALYLGIRMCRERGVNQLWIELDSQTLSTIISSGKKGNWLTYGRLAEVRRLLAGISWKISHVGREANSPADLLANLGVEMESSVTYQGIPAVRKLEGAIDAESRGWPYIRRRGWFL